MPGMIFDSGGRIPDDLAAWGLYLSRRRRTPAFNAAASLAASIGAEVAFRSLIIGM